MDKIKRFSNKYFEYVAKEYAIRYFSSIPEDKDIKEPHIFSEKFYDDFSKTLQIFNNQKQISKSTKRIIALIAAIIAIILASLSVGAVREALYKLFFLDKNEISATVQYQYEANGDDSDDIILAHNELEIIYKPGYIVEGNVELEEDYLNGRYYVIYTDGNKTYKYTQYVLESDFIIDYEDIIYESLTINNVEVLVKNSGESFSAYWSNNGYAFKVNGLTSKDDIVKIIESLYVYR